MNIDVENIDELNAVIKVKITLADYSGKYTEALKKYQLSMVVPGFRQGHVPMNLVMKKFGKDAILQVVNGLLSESLHKYISENKIDILGSPLPKAENKIDFENSKDFEFQFEIGLAPKINMELSVNEKYPYYTIKSDEALIDKHVESFRRNFGQVIHPEISEDKDVLVGDFVEVDIQGNIVPGGFLKTSVIDIGRISSAITKSKLIGLKADDKVVLGSLTEDLKYLSETLEYPFEKIASLALQFQLKNLNRIVPAAVNQDLFDKIYGVGKVSSEEEFRNNIREELAVIFAGDGDRKFFNDIMEGLISKANLKLPEGFLKKFILTISKTGITKEQVEREYDSYAKALKWQLIEHHLLKTHNIVVPVEEVQQFVTNAVKMNFVRQGMQNVTEEELGLQVKRIMGDEKQVRGAYDRIYDQKLIELFKNTLAIDKKEITYDDFFKPEKASNIQ